jgi:hypothetical protein
MKSAVVFTVTLVFSIATVVEFADRRKREIPMAIAASIAIKQNFNMNLV